MRPPAALLLTAALHLYPSCAPALPTTFSPSYSPHPLIIWHGLGDTFTNPSLQSLADIYTSLYPHTSTHIISLSPSGPSDRTSTFLGHIPTQVSQVCQTLLSLPAPFNNTRSHLLGLSQGGQFLRALVQTCPLPHPPATLLTFGSQHSGISKFLPSCAPSDWTCKTTAALLDHKKWSTWAQHHLVPAQYFRDPADLDTYLMYSEFLADINNERPEKNHTYKHNLRKLDKFVMYIFEDDKTVYPKESGWFADVDPYTGQLVKLRETALYKEDWLGLRELDGKAGLVFDAMPGHHMSLSEDLVKEAFIKYFAPAPEPEEEL